jgi:uncharacterized SAM-binding protein YcdF (DUF218 family)
MDMYHFVAGLLQPFTLVVLFTGLALANLWRKRREARGRLLAVTVPFVALAVFCTPAVGYLALGTLEWHHPPLFERPADAGAIVVLAGYVFPPDRTRPRAVPAEDTYYRCLKAAELYHQKWPCPVVVSGGKVDPHMPGPACATVMYDFLRQLGVNAADLIVEDGSRTTYENAVACRSLLDHRGIRKIVLVTEATHLDRAAACFRKQGLDVVPGGCHYRATRFEGSPLAFVPSPGAAATCHRVWHEWLGTCWYWLWGRI